MFINGVKEVMVRRLFALAFAVGVAGIPVSGHAQQDPSVEDLQGSLEVFFAKVGGSLINMNGSEGEPGHWAMERRISGATTVRRCFTLLETPEILSQTNSSPTTSYGIDWSQVRAVAKDSEWPMVYMAADHMAQDEAAALIFDSDEDAERIAAVFLFLMEECGGG